MKTKLLFIVTALLLGCANKTETQSGEIDSLTVDSLETAVVFSPPPNSKTVRQNFAGYIDYALTQDDNEAKVWDVLGPIIMQYDTTNFHTLSKNYTMPGTEETPDETLTTSQNVTITLYYDNDQKLRAVKREDNYEVGSSERFDRAFALYLFDGDLIAIYEDIESYLDMAVKNYSRGVAKACPDCGVTLSAGISSAEVTVSGSLNSNDFARLARVAQQEESNLLETAYAGSFVLAGDEYVYQTVEPLNEEADYDVFYTASKGYYEKFMKPKMNR